MSDPRDRTEAEQEVLDLKDVLGAIYDMLEPIESGKIDKGIVTRTPKNFADDPYRKTMLKDAKNIVHHVRVRIRMALSEEGK